MNSHLPGLRGPESAIDTRGDLRHSPPIPLVARVAPCLGVLVSLLAFPTLARSDSRPTPAHGARPQTAATSEPPGEEAPRSSHRHALYLEIFGKGGLYGIGYDYRWPGRLGAGLGASAYEVDGERILSLSPYLSVYPLVRGHHGLFASFGPQLVDHKVSSPVAGWDGEHSLSYGAQLSVGYEYRSRLLFRGYVMAAAGKGGVSPWAGASIGVAF